MFGSPKGVAYIAMIGNLDQQDNFMGADSIAGKFGSWSDGHVSDSDGIGLPTTSPDRHSTT